jgi:hypothetical protein
MMETSRWYVGLALAFMLALAPACSTKDSPVTTDAVVALDTAAEGGGPLDSGPAVDTPLASDAVFSDGTPDAATPDATIKPDATTKPLPRGLKWVRNNPMFVSGLVTSMKAPSASAVTDYFSGFKANALHLWETGLPTELDGWRKHAGASMRFVSWVHKDGTSHTNKKLIGGLPANSPGRIGFQISDEPNDMTHFNAMVTAATAVRKADPDALLIFNFTYNLPQLDQALAQSGSSTEMDVYSYDVYTRSNGAYEHLARYRTVGLKYNRPYWRYIRGYLPSFDKDDALTESDARWDAFSGLVYGYTGHTWFLYQIATGHNLQPAFFAAPGSYAAKKTAAFSFVATINTELKQLGRAITQLTSTDVRYTPSIGLLQPKKTQPFAPGAGGDPYITKIAGKGGAAADYLVGFFTDAAGERYVMLQNVKHVNGTFPVDLLVGPVTFEVDLDFKSAAVDKTKLLSLDKSTGKLTALPLTGLGGSKARLSVTLAAGDPVLFKYATGAPFALGK